MKNQTKKWQKTFLQRRYFYKEAYKWHQENEKMLNVTNYQGNANNNLNEISPHTSQIDYHQKEHK